MTIKKGDILQRKDSEYKVMVLAVLEDLVFVSEENNYKRASSSNYHRAEIEKQFTLLAAPWVPEVDEIYWYVNFGTSTGVDWSYNSNDSIDKKLFANNAAYPTEAAALAAYQKAKEAMKV